MKANAPILPAAVFLLASSIAHAATWYVATTGNDSNPGSQASPFRTIARGIAAAAASGDTIQVAAGTYSEHIAWNAKDLTLQGAGAGQSIIDGGGTGTCLTLTGVPSTARLSGFTIQNGNSGFYSGGGMANTDSHLTVINCTFSNNSGGIGGVGGGMYNANSNPIVTNCTFTGNSTVGGLNGGGMYNTNSGPIVSNCTFSGNSAGGGGGMYQESGAAMLSHCTFTGNSVPLGGHGGAGIFNSSNSLTVIQCTFANNQAALGAYGAGINNTGANATVVGCTFSSNNAELGGGMYNYAAGVTVANCMFTGNVVGLGGGMYNFVSGVTAVNCVFSNNTTSSSNGGGTGMCNDGTNATITNCTFYNNNTARYGVISNVSGSSPTLTNCIMVNSGQAISNDSSSGASVTYSDIQGGYAGTGNINADPLFVQAGSDNYRLQGNSPCINTGSAAAAALRLTDLDGLPRIQGSAPDMGAYETWAAGYGVWCVDRTLGNDTTGVGSPTAPFATVVRAINAASNGHTVCIKQGNYGTDRPRITKSLRLFNWGDTGLARIGQP